MTGVRLAAFWASTLLVGPGSGVQQPGLVVEPSSGRAFPIALRVPGVGDLHTLVGTGIRTKTFLRVKVYAFGLYVDAPTASSALQAWAGRSARDLGPDAAGGIDRAGAAVPFGTAACVFAARRGMTQDRLR